MSRGGFAAVVAVAVLLFACGDDDAEQAGAAEPERPRTPDAGASRTDAAASPVDAGTAGPADAAAASDAALAPPRQQTFGNGLVLTDAAIEAINSLTPEQRMQTARCDSGPVDGGIGLTCTPRGGECEADLTCTARFRGDSGICTRLGCGATPEVCGPGASCCTLVQAGGVSLCFPDDCYPTTCLELFQ